MKPVMRYVSDALPALLILSILASLWKPTKYIELNVEKINSSLGTRANSLQIVPILPPGICQARLRPPVGDAWRPKRGMPGASSNSGIQIARVVVKFLSEVNRERVFLLAVKSGCMSKVFQDLHCNQIHYLQRMFQYILQNTFCYIYLLTGNILILGCASGRK